MMKWKVVRNQPRSQSADRSLECLKKSENNNNDNDGPNDSNNNVGEEGKENKAPAKESSRQRASSLVRKTATECINLRSILGLARQRSETNLSSVGLVQPPPEPARRSRSEVRLAAGCQTRSTSPPAKSSVGWLRGRKRERKSRKSEAGDVTSGKTVVTESQRKKRSAGTPKQECRTTADSSSGDRTKGGSAGPRKSKSRRKEKDIIEEEDIYIEIGRREEDTQPALPNPRRAGRKKGQAPRPAAEPVRASPTRRRPSQKNTGKTVRSVQSLAVEEAVVPSINQPTTVVAEVHEELIYLSMDHRTAKNSEYESLALVQEEPLKAMDRATAGPDEVLPFHIDTPDYSTLESTTVDAPVEVGPYEPGAEDRCEGKSVRFGKMDLIDQYRKHKTAGEESTAEDSSDVNESKDSEEREDGVAAVSAAVRNCWEEDSPTPFVVKKSFVLTVAKQEKGFQSLCANKKPEPPPEPPANQISVTFRCSDCPADDVRKRSTSVPPIKNPQEGFPILPAIRGRSRDRKSKERKKGKGRKKDSAFVMPQAVIDELSQVLEKRKPSLDEMPTPFLQHPSPS